MRLAGGFVTDLHARDLRGEDALGFWERCPPAGGQVGPGGRAPPGRADGDHRRHPRLSGRRRWAWKCCWRRWSAPMAETDRFLGLYQPISMIQRLMGRPASELGVRKIQSLGPANEESPRLLPGHPARPPHRLGARDVTNFSVPGGRKGPTRWGDASPVSRARRAPAGRPLPVGLVKGRSSGECRPRWNGGVAGPPPGAGSPVGPRRTGSGPGVAARRRCWKANGRRDAPPRSFPSAAPNVARPPHAESSARPYRCILGAGRPRWPNFRLWMLRTPDPRPGGHVDRRISAPGKPRSAPAISASLWPPCRRPRRRSPSGRPGSLRNPAVVPARGLRASVTKPPACCAG